MAGPVKEEGKHAKHGVLAITSFAAALFFILASVDYAGMAGNFVYRWLNQFLGMGFYVLPFILFLLGLSFLRTPKPHFVSSRLTAGIIFFLAVLGIIGVLFEPSQGRIGGGLIGRLIARSLNKPFGPYGLILLGAAGLSALIVLFDTKLKLPKPDLPRLFALGAKFFNLLKPKPASEPTAVQPEQPDREKEPAPIQTPTIDSEPKSMPLFQISSWGKAGNPDFTPPPLSLLASDSGRAAAGDIKANLNIIKRTLQNFGISVEMDEVSIGPSITRYTLKPAEGVRLARIVALQNDLALTLAAHPLRIEAPIPGKSLVGIEVPNRTKSLVGLGSLLNTPAFTESPDPLPVSLGRDISGTPRFASLSRAPHILIAGATGSGKSVVIHSFILSLFYRNSPDRLRFILIDPKRVELPLYNRIPHLLAPVITDAKKVIASLRWAAQEMERRYSVLETFQVRDIASYHKNVLEGSGGGADENLDKLPYLVIVIDELADIMASYPRELEAAIIRLAQMSRAVGIHLVLSTQRPSVEVITGLIKANISTRIALQVASQVDSRTILDMAGAEKLLGAGDMLYISAEMSKPVRLQGAFVSEEEVKRVVDFLSKQYRNLDLTAAGGEQIDTYRELSEPRAARPPEEWEGLEDDDVLYGAAHELITKAGKASASYLQRRLKIGYARAARLLDLLEERGVIGPPDGAKQRIVYAPNNLPTSDATGTGEQN